MGTQAAGRGGCLSLTHKGDGREKAALPFRSASEGQVAKGHCP